eukprot:2442565-Prymnesium_polylepis.1
MSWTWAGRAVRDAALVGGQTRQQDEGWWGGADRTIGDRHPRQWWLVRVGDVRFLLLLPDCARRVREKCNLARGATP